MGKTPRNRSGHSAIIDDQAKIFIFGGYSVSNYQKIFNSFFRKWDMLMICLLLTF